VRGVVNLVRDDVAAVRDDVAVVRGDVSAVHDRFYLVRRGVCGVARELGRGRQRVASDGRRLVRVGGNLSRAAL
jgi:hypothetical protein